jgi:hypothetical protein
MNARVVAAHPLLKLGRAKSKSMLQKINSSAVPTWIMLHRDSMVAATTTHAPAPCQLLLVALLLRPA